MRRPSLRSPCSRSGDPLADACAEQPSVSLVAARWEAIEVGDGTIRPRRERCADSGARVQHAGGLQPLLRWLRIPLSRLPDPSSARPLNVGIEASMCHQIAAPICCGGWRIRSCVDGLGADCRSMPIGFTVEALHGRRNLAARPAASVCRVGPCAADARFLDGWVVASVRHGGRVIVSHPPAGDPYRRQPSSCVGELGA